MYHYMKKIENIELTFFNKKRHTFLTKKNGTKNWITLFNKKRQAIYKKCHLPLKVIIHDNTIFTFEKK